MYLATGIALIILTLITIPLIILIRAIMKKTSPERLVKVTMVVAWIWVSISVLTAIAFAVSTLVNTQVEVSFPVQPFWPALPEGVEISGTQATLQTGGYTEITGLVSGLSSSTRLMLAVTQALSALIPGAIALLVWLAARSFLRGSGFAAIMYRWIMVTAIVVTAGGILAQVTGDIAAGQISQDVLEWTAASYPETFGDQNVIDDVFPNPSGFAITLPFWPIAAGLGLATLGVFFKHGATLQRDTEGLV